MPTLKYITIEALKNVPPSASLEEIRYKINLAAEVMEGIKNAGEGKVIWTEKASAHVDCILK